MKPALIADHWAACGPTGWTVRFYVLPRRPFPYFDLFALARCLGLRSKQVRSAGVRGVRKVLAFNKTGEARPAWIAPPAAAAALIAKASELGRPGVDEVERDFAAAFHATVDKVKEAA